MENNNTRKIIVLADNDPFITRVYKSGLEEAGYDVVVAEDGEAALEQARSRHPDLVLLEIILPKLDGFTVLKTLKADDTTSTIPVIILTSLSQESDQNEARTSGAVDFLVKSEVSLNDILVRIKRALSEL